MKARTIMQAGQPDMNPPDYAQNSACDLGSMEMRAQARKSLSFPRKRESTSSTKVSGFPLSSRFRGSDRE